MLVQTEQFNEKHFHNEVIKTMQKAIQKEAKFNCFYTCHNLLKLFFYYEQEYFKLRNPDKLDMLTELVRICQILNEHSENYKDEFEKMELDPEFETCLFIELKKVHSQFKRVDMRPEFLNHLERIMDRFR